MLSLLLSWRLAFGASLKNIQKFTRTSATIYAGTKNFLASQRIGPATNPPQKRQTCRFRREPIVELRQGSGIVNAANRMRSGLLGHPRILGQLVFLRIPKPAVRYFDPEQHASRLADQSRGLSHPNWSSNPRQVEHVCTKAPSWWTRATLVEELELSDLGAATRDRIVQQRIREEARDVAIAAGWKAFVDGIRPTGPKRLDPFGGDLPPRAGPDQAADS